MLTYYRPLHSAKNGMISSIFSQNSSIGRLGSISSDATTTTFDKLLPAILLLVGSLGLLLISLTSRFSNQQMVSNAEQLARSFAEQSVLTMVTGSTENAEPVLRQMQAFSDLVAAGLWSKENQLLVWRGDEATAKRSEEKTTLAASSYRTQADSMAGTVLSSLR